MTCMKDEEYSADETLKIVKMLGLIDIIKGHINGINITSGYLDEYTTVTNMCCDDVEEVTLKIIEICKEHFDENL